METILSFQNTMILFQKDFKSKNLGHFLCLKIEITLPEGVNEIIIEDCQLMGL